MPVPGPAKTMTATDKKRAACKGSAAGNLFCGREGSFLIKMSNEPLNGLARLERDLWEAADQLRANSKLTSSEYCMPVLGVIFLRHATNRFDAADEAIKADVAAGRLKRKIVKDDYLSRRALYLPEQARYDYIMDLPSGSDLCQALVDAMMAIEGQFEPLVGILPKDYTIFDQTVLEDLLRIFNREALKTARGDVFGRIYEYFLQEFAIQGAQDNGEFFTPPSLVQTIVNFIEPDHGIVFDPACGSGGMFVQSSHFIEGQGQDPAHRVTFYGQEKTATTIRLAKMNLAVHGLEGDIREANTFYEDVHTLYGKGDFVMANPPFNVDMVDAEKIKDDRRLPFGLPGVNKGKKVSNGNYLWISYFYSYLNDKGRAGFVMSSQASSAGHGERDVRRKIVETGHVDALIAIRSNFFYTRTVPCELWFFDRGKPDHLRDKVLMIDARNVFRKVSRKINDFSPEQLANLTAISWLYRGQTDRFLSLATDYFGQICAECGVIPAALDAFDAALDAFSAKPAAFVKGAKQNDCAPLMEAVSELDEARNLYRADRDRLTKDITKFCKSVCGTLPATNAKQHAAREAFDPIAEHVKGLVKQVDLLHKLATRVLDTAVSLADTLREGDGELARAFDRRGAAKALKDLDTARKDAVEQLKRAVYFHKQVTWLQARFPEAKLCDVPGLVKLVSRTEIEAADWSLTPGRFVGVAAAEEDEDFDFEQTIRDIHTELADLNREAVELASRIQANFEELGI